MRVRAGDVLDFPSLRQILKNAPEASQWLPERYDFLVAVEGEILAGFLVWRFTAPDEIEILNLAVDPSHRRKGIARALLTALPPVDVLLEVRESNLPARSLYRNSGFIEVGLRPKYYSDPVEGAVVMRLQS